MTVIIGARTPGGCIIAADGRNFSEGGGQNPIMEPKITRQNDWLLYSFAGSWRMSQILDHHIEVDPDDSPGFVDFQALRWLVRTFVPAMKEALDSHDWKRHGDDTDEWPIHPGVVAVGDRIFYIDGGYHVCEPSLPYITAGAGEAEASAAMYVQLRNRDKLTKKAALDACSVSLEAVFYHRADCGPPVNWAETVVPGRQQWYAGREIFEEDSR